MLTTAITTLLFARAYLFLRICEMKINLKTAFEVKWNEVKIKSTENMRRKYVHPNG